MRKAALASLVFVACGFATNAQLSVTPRVGIEQALTCVKYNSTDRISPMGSNFSPQVGLRMDYLIQKSHGPFVGVSTNRSVVTYEFTNPETGDKEFTASQGDWKLRLEAGYQYSSKPIALGKAVKQPATKAPGAYQSPCAARRMMMANASAAAAAKMQTMNLRIQPYAGVAFVPNPQTAISSTFKSNETVYQYSAGNWTSAITTGVNLAFAKGSTNKFVIGVQYLTGISNMNEETLTTPLDNKQLNTKLSSHASAWNVTVGMPLSFSKPKPAVVKSTVEAPAKVQEPVKVEAAKPAAAPVKKSCGYYRRCTGY
jgi:archaellin